MIESHSKTNLSSNLEPEEDDVVIEQSLRPQSLDEYIGQTVLKENLKIVLGAAKKKKRTLRTFTFLWSSRAWKNNFSKSYC